MKTWVFKLLAVCGMVNGVETPQYLYKILSYRNWQATENRRVVSLSGDDKEFIHLSTEEQLGRILEKYWADVAQYVVLKLDVSKLRGRLQYEANPGGSTRYYHLYDGFIPFQAIREARLTLREPLAPLVGSSLDIVQAGDPVLRKKARPLSKEEILSPEIQTLIEEMKAAMRAAPGVGLAAPQIGKPIQLVVIEDMEHSHLTSEQLKERDRRKFPFQVVINPSLYIEDAESASFFEGCLSVPAFLAVVPRAKAVRVECLNEKGEQVVIRAKGWQARILQHEVDHLNGTLFIDRALKETVTTEENYVKLWNGKPIQAVCECLR